MTGYLIQAPEKNFNFALKHDAAIIGISQYSWLNRLEQLRRATAEVVRVYLPVYTVSSSSCFA